MDTRIKGPYQTLHPARSAKANGLDSDTCLNSLLGFM